MKKNLLFAVFFSICICSFAAHATLKSNNTIKRFVPPIVTTNPSNTEVCEGETATFTADGTGADTYIWQINVGAGWTNLSDDITYAGVSTTTLTIANPVFSMDQYDYRLELSNMDGSVATMPANLKVEELPDASISVTDATCDVSTGSITFTFTDNDTRSNIEFSIDGGSSYSYNYQDTTSPQTVSNLSPDTYNVWVRWGNNECPVDLGEYTINSETSPTAIFDASTSTSCGLNNGSLSFTLLDILTRTEISFSTNNGSTYDYTFDDSSGTGTFSDLAAGNYDIWVSYDGDCPTSLGQYTVSSGSSAATATVETIDASTGNSDGLLSLSFSDDATQTAIEFSIDGGVNYDYSFDDTLGSAEISSLATNTYAIWVRHGDGTCASDLGNFTINEVEYTSIPDSNFESVLNGLGYDNYLGDNKVPTALIEVVTTLTAQFEDITDFTGIEDFVALESLAVSYNSFTELDVSNNVNLTFLNCGYSTLTSLDVSNNTLLETLWVNSSNISTLDLSQNTSLTSLTASSMSNLSSLNMQNGNNTNVTNFTTVSAPNLECILVDDATYSTTNWTNIDGTTSFNDTTSCINYTAIPDADFEAALETLGYDDISGDGQVPTALIEVVTSLDIRNFSIADLTGLEDFTALVTLLCRASGINTIDVSQNLLLETLTANNNSIATIDLSNNTALKSVNLGANSLTTLDVSNNTALTSLSLQASSGLTSIDISNNTLLKDLKTYSSNIATLDLSNNPLLTTVQAYGTPMTTIDISNNPDIQDLQIHNTNIAELDLSNNPDIEQLRVNDTGITTLDLSNLVALERLYANDMGLTYLNVQNGNNTNVSTFRLTDNPSLSCILVDDPAYSKANWTEIDAGLIFADTYCDYTAIPDANFEAELEALGYDDISNDGQVPTTLIEGVTSLDVSSSSIANLTGIEDFIALTTLSASDNSLINVDVSANTLLTSLSLHTNSLTSIDVTNNTQLTLLSVSFNELITIDITNNVLLESFYCNNNDIADIDISLNVNIKFSNFSDNEFTTLDFSGNSLLSFSSFNNNNLESLNLQNGTNESLVLQISASGNPNLSCILVDDVDYSTDNWTDIDVTTSFNSIACGYTTIPDANFEAALEALGYDDISNDGQVPTVLIAVVTELNTLDGLSIADLTGIEDFVALQKLWFNQNDVETIDVSNLSNLTSIRAVNNEFTTLDLTNNILLTDIRVEENDIATIDLSQNTELTILQINDNALTSLDLTNNTKLTRIRLGNNQLTSLDLSNQIIATQIQVEDNQLTYLNVQNGNNTNISTFSATNNPNLNCILVEDAVYSSTNWTNIDVQTTFSDSDYCEYTTIADANFEAELEALGYDDISADGQVPTALIEVVTTLSVNNKSISDLTGIEDFVALTYLDCRGNTITNLDVSNSIQLATLLCQDNGILASLDLSGNTQLTNLVCDGNQLTTLNIDACTLLESINISFNPIASISLINNTLLETFTAEDTNLTALDFRNNPSLVEVEVVDSQLTSLNIKNGNNTNISDFYITGNAGLTCVEVDDAAYSTTNWTDIDVQTTFSEAFCNTYTAIPDANFEAALEALGYDDNSSDGQVPTALIEGVATLNIRDEGIADLTGIENFVALTQLNVSKNNLTTVNIYNNTALETIFLSENQLTSVNVSNNTNLTYLDIGENMISTVDVSSNTALTILEASDNNLTALDVTALTNLESLYFSDNDIATIDVSNNLLLRNFGADNCVLTGFDASGLANLESISIQSNPDFETLDVTGATSLTHLVIRSGKLTAADVSTNVNLEIIFLDGHELTSFDMTNNPLVEILIIGSNPLLEALDLRNGSIETLTSFQSTGNDLLTCINVDNPFYATNNLTNIDAHTSFGINECGVYAYIPDDNFEAALGVLGYDDITDDNQIPLINIEMLTTLDVSGEGIIDLTGIEEFVALTDLNLSGNAIVTADFSTNPLISVLNIANNQIVQLDLSSNTALTSIDASQNELVSFNMQNGVNTNITNFNATTNANLTCILVDVATYSTTNWTNIDLQTAFNETDCTQYTAIPDANFEAALDALGYDNISGDGQVPTLNINTITTLNVASENIADLTGIEDFVALTTLDCSLNTLTTIDVSNNINLLDLDADENLFVTIDVSNNTLLQDLDLDNCMLESIDLTTNTQLVDVDLQGNFLTTINLSNNLLLEIIDLETNDLTSLDVSNNILIEELDIEDNEIATLVLPTSTSLVDFDATNNMITSIDVSSYVNLEILDVDENQLTAVDVSLNTALTRLKVNDNNLISLSINNGNNTSLTTFDATNNIDLYCILVDDEAYSTSNFTAKDAQTSYNETSCDFVIVDVDVFLQGALINPNTGEEDLMRDDLRVAGGLYGSNSPYGDGASMNESVGLSDSGENATVDWIWVELRDANSSTTVIAGQSAILQRDGDIVATDEDLVTPLTFDNVPAGDYFIVIKHRNHLGIMSSTAITLKQVSTTIDFTDANNEITFGSNAQTTFGMPTDVVAMWCGNANEDSIIQYSGTNPDTPDILSTVLNDAGNFLNFPTYVVSGYDANDVNMDGNTQYSGTDPDTPFILQNVLAHPSNFLGFSTYQIIEQLPEIE